MLGNKIYNNNKLFKVVFEVRFENRFENHHRLLSIHRIATAGCLDNNRPNNFNNNAKYYLHAWHDDAFAWLQSLLP